MQIFAYKCQDLNEVMIVFEILTVVLTKLAKFADVTVVVGELLRMLRIIESS